MTARIRSGLAQGLSAWATHHMQSLLSSAGSLTRSPLGTVLTVSVIGLALALPAGLFLLVDGARQIAGEWDGQPRISLFLRAALDDDAARRLGAELRALPGVAGTRVIGKREGWRTFREAAGISGLTDGFGADNPLPAVVVVAAESSRSADVEALAERLGGLPEVDLAQVDLQWIERLEALLDLASRFATLLGLLMGTGVVLVVGNTLRLSIDARRTEIEVQKLFGASDSFVRRPFLYHGALYGLAGALLACLLLAVSVLLMSAPVDRLESLYPALAAVEGLRAHHLLAVLGCGLALGLLAAWLTVARHLHAVQPR